MSLYLEHFGTVALPLLEAEQDVGTEDSYSAVLVLPGGSQYDAYGSGQAPGLPAPIVAKGTVTEATLAAIQTTIDALKATRGQKLKLFARCNDSKVRWRWARLQKAPIVRRSGELMWREVEMTFIPSAAGWYGEHHGGGWLLDSGYFFDSGMVLDEATGDLFTLAAGSGNPNSCVVSNPGNAAVRNAILTIDCKVTPITAVHVVQAGLVDWTWADAATLPINKALVINCGMPSIKNDGADAWAKLTLNAGQVIPEWLRLDPTPAVNTVVITLTGGGTTSTATFDFSEAWE